MPPSENSPYSIHGSKDEHRITQKDTQPSQTCSGGFINAHFFAICYLLVFETDPEGPELEGKQVEKKSKAVQFFEIGEYNLDLLYRTVRNWYVIQ